MTRLSREAALHALWRFGAAALVAGACALALQDRLIDAALPALRAWLQVVDATYRTVDLSVVQLNGEAMVQRVATPSSTHTVGTQIVSADPRTRLVAQAGAGLVLQPLVLAAALLLAWPWRRTIEIPLRLVFVAPLMLMVVALDVPMILYGAAWQKEVSLVAPDFFSPLVYWPDYMNAGGRFVLTIAAVAAAVMLGRAASGVLCRINSRSA